jgi:hypothetical protein
MEISSILMFYLQIKVERSLPGALMIKEKARIALEHQFMSRTFLISENNSLPALRMGIIFLEDWKETKCKT